MQDLSFKRFKLRWFAALYIILTIAGAVYVGVAGNTQDTMDITNILIASALLLYILYKRKRQHISFSEMPMQEAMTKKRWTKYMSFALVVKIVGIIAFAFIGMLIMYIFKDSLGWIIELINSAEVAQMEPLNYVYAFILICILAPLWEELFFRGILLRRCAMKWSIPTSIIVSSLIFGLLHFGGNSMIHAALFGSFLAVVYLKTKNIWVPIILHSAMNFLSFVAMFVPTEEGELALPANDEMQQTLWIMGILVVISSAILIFLIVKNWGKLRAIPKIEEPVEVVDYGTGSQVVWLTEENLQNTSQDASADLEETKPTR